MLMQLTQKEFDRHSGKMDLRKVRRPSVYAQRVRLADEKGLIFDDPDLDRDDPALTVTVPPGNGLFLLAKGCDNLTEDHRCSIYEDRPTCCRTFEVGSTACLKARRKAGLDDGRPIPEDDAAPPGPVQQLVQHFFGDVKPEGAEHPAPVPVEQPRVLFLAGVRTSVSRETRWIIEQLGECKSSDWSRKTRCAGWNVTALAAHMTTCVQTAHAVTQAAIDHRPARLPRDFKGDRFAVTRAFTAATDNVLVALDRLSPDVLAHDVDVDGEGVLTPAHVLEVLVMELAVHGLDLAAALGVERHLQPEGISAAAHLLLEFLDPAMTPSANAAYVLRSSAFDLAFTWDGEDWINDARPGACVIEGAPEAVLLYALGRVPFNQSALETNDPDAARAFKRYLAGP
jgi:uncharacterized protein (TIGR03083 family)